MTPFDQNISNKINSFTQLDRCRLEYALSGNKPEYIKGYEDAIDDAIQYIRDNIDSSLVIYHQETWCSLDKFIETMRNNLIK